MAGTSLKFRAKVVHLESHPEFWRGAEVSCQRQVAKIVPISKTGDFDGEMLELAALGQLQLPGRSLDLRSFFALSAPKTVADKLRAAIEEEREED